MPVTLFEEMGMNLHHDALVLVADGQKYLLIRNSGDFRNPVLKVEASAERSGAPTRDLGSDQPGRAYSSVGGTPSAMEQTDLHQQAKEVLQPKLPACLPAVQGVTMGPKS
jgi:protein required for attachment to host cells